MSKLLDDWSQTKSDSHLALLYGEIKEGKSPVHILDRFGQEAYETLQLHIYITELLRVRDEKDYLCWSPGFGLLYAGLEVIFGEEASGIFRKPASPCVEEIGSTLFATIDKIAKLHDQQKGSFQFEKVKFMGVEPCSIFCRVATEMHPHNCLKQVKYWSDLPPASPNTVARSYQATSYAFKSVSELCDWIARSVCSVHGLWFSQSKDDQTIIIHGKRIVLFSLEKFCENLKGRGFQLFPISSDSYTLGQYQFMSVFVCVHRFTGEQNRRFELLCRSNANWGIPYSMDEAPENPVFWVRSKVVQRDSHAHFINPLNFDATNPILNFGSNEVIDQFRAYIEVQGRSKA